MRPVPLVLIVGGRGCGKTTLALRLVRSWPSWRVLCYNPTADPRLAHYVRFDPAADRVELRGRCLLLDEVDHILPSGAPNLSGWRYNAVELGRHLPVAIVATARRPQACHRTLRSYATDVFVGHLGSRLDLDFAAREWGESAARADTLPAFRFVHIQP